MSEDEIRLIYTALLTSGTYEGKVAALVIESLAMKMEQADPTGGQAVMTTRAVADWLRECKEKVLSI